MSRSEARRPAQVSEQAAHTARLRITANRNRSVTAAIVPERLALTQLVADERHVLVVRGDQQGHRLPIPIDGYELMEAVLPDHPAPLMLCLVAQVRQPIDRSGQQRVDGV